MRNKLETELNRYYERKPKMTGRLDLVLGVAVLVFVFAIAATPLIIAIMEWLQ